MAVGAARAVGAAAREAMRAAEAVMMVVAEASGRGEGRAMEAGARATVAECPAMAEDMVVGRTVAVTRVVVVVVEEVTAAVATGEAALVAVVMATAAVAVAPPCAGGMC